MLTAVQSKSSSTQNTAQTSPQTTIALGQTAIHALLALWSLQKKEGKAVSEGKLSKYKDLLHELEQANAIEIDKKGRYRYVSILDAGKQQLIQGLIASDFCFGGTIASSREVNDALELLKQQVGAIGVAEPNGKAASPAIASYEEFKAIALEVYDRLNRDYNMENLVPIYRIRREIGDRVSRPQFSNWLFEMQSEDVFQLLEGSVEDNAPDKVEDSVMTNLGKLRCYAKRLAA
ncbi:MAG: hypothetical protein Kow00121_34660 [Elainellaceae cyanobacterium]